MLRFLFSRFLYQGSFVQGSFTKVPLDQVTLVKVPLGLHPNSYCRFVWFILFCGGVYYGYLLYTPALHDWFYNPAVHDVEKTDFYVKELPFPAITICSNNKIVKRQLESVLLTQPWKGYNKKIANFPHDFESALTSLVLAQEYPHSLSHLSQGTIDILNEHKDALPDVMTKVKII